MSIILRSGSSGSNLRERSWLLLLLLRLLLLLLLLRRLHRLRLRHLWLRLRHSRGVGRNLLSLHGSVVWRLNVFMGVGLLIGHLTMYRGSRVTLGLLRGQDCEPGIPDTGLLNDHRNHVVVTWLWIMMGAHMLRHCGWGHGKWGAGLTDELVGILHGYLRIGNGLIVLTGHPRTGRHLMGIQSSIHGVRWVLEDGGLGIRRLRRLRCVG